MLRLAFVLAIACAFHGAEARADPVDASTLFGKMIMGYQGWFACPGGGSGRGWSHWKNGQNEVTVDMLPEVGELTPGERCDSGLVGRDGRAISFFSDQNPTTVDRHFAWMETYGIDGVALQWSGVAEVRLRPAPARGQQGVGRGARQRARRRRAARARVLSHV